MPPFLTTLPRPFTDSSPVAPSQPLDSKFPFLSQTSFHAECYGLHSDQIFYMSYPLLTFLTTACELSLRLVCPQDHASPARTALAAAASSCQAPLCSHSLPGFSRSMQL